MTHPIAALIAGVPDYDAGLLNDYGGGNVDWWQDYLRAEIGRANEAWRENVLAALEAATPPDLVEALADADQMIDFLSGQDNIDGMAFGDPNENGHRFWWRKHLSRFEALIALATAQAAQIAGLTKERDETYSHAKYLAEVIFAKGQFDAPQWEPLEDTLGVLTQIDNMVAGIRAEAEAATLRAEVERLRGALQAFKDFDDLPTMAKRPDVFELRVRQPILAALEDGKC